MARLFIGQREIQFINDLTKEFIKDVVGQVIHYFPVSVIKSRVHGLYNESTEKVFDNPIKVPALVGQPEWSSKTTSFGPDLESRLEVMIQARDLADKGIKLSEGDMFTFDDVLYEILTYVNMNNIFGMAEYDVSWKITAKSARLGQMDPASIPLPRKAPDGEQVVFEQQRGLPITSDGEATGDIREMRQRLSKDMAPVALGTGARRVEPNTGDDGDFIQGSDASSFNNDPPPPKKGIYDDE